MKRYAETIHVEMQSHRPVRIWRGDQRLVVEDVVDSWVVQGRWWAQEERRTYYRVITPRGTLDIYCSDGCWQLSRVQD